MEGPLFRLVERWLTDPEDDFLCTVGVCLDNLTIHGHCKCQSKNL